MGQRHFSAVKHIFALRCEVVHFSWPFFFQIPFAFKVSFSFKSGKKRIDSARSKIDSEVLAEGGDDLVSVHRLTSQKL